MSLAALVLVGSGAYALGQRRGPERITVERVTSTSGPILVSPAVSPSLSAADRAALREEIVAAVRAELAAKTPAQRDAPPPGPPLPTSEQTAALAKAQTILDRAIDDGHWGIAQRDAVRPLMHALNDADLTTLLTAFAHAVNDGRVRIDFHGAPL
jgi:hypothetical protein